MNPNKINISLTFIQRWFLATVGLALVLVLFGRILVPAINIVSLAGACLILVIYGILGYFAFPRIQLGILRMGFIFGLLAGALYAGEILLEYAILPKDNSLWGLVEFGGVFFIVFLTALLTTARSNVLKQGVFSAILAALISAAIWLMIVLAVFYIFRGTDRQFQVFTAEGNFEDFARSGMTDFETFIIEDFFGGGFFHLLLSPILAVVLGSIGSLFGKGIFAIRNTRR